MARLFKFLHVIATIGLLGSLAALLAMVTGATRLPADQVLVTHQALVWTLYRVTLPSVALLWLTGLLSIAVRTAFLEMGWVWVKLILGMAMTGIVFIILWPGSDAVAERAAQTGTASLRALFSQGLDREILWTSIAIFLGAAATAFGIWRPRIPGFTVTRTGGH